MMGFKITKIIISSLVVFTAALSWGIPAFAAHPVYEPGKFASVAVNVCTHAAALPRPRSLPQGGDLVTLKNALMSGSLSSLFAAQKNAVRFDNPRWADLVDEPAYSQAEMLAAGKTKDDYAAKVLGWKKDVDRVAGVGVGAANIYAISGETEFRDIAVRRFLNLANMDPTAATSFSSNDLASNVIMHALTTALDLMYDDFTASERTTMINSINARLTQSEAVILRPNGGMYDTPASGHGYPILGQMAVTSLLTSGLVSKSDDLCRENVDLFLSVTSPWGGDDGGVSQGIAYGVWDHGAILSYLDKIRVAGGVDVTINPWVQNFGRFMLYFHPPGSPSALFGDGAELPFESAVATVMKSYIRYIPANPLYDWYASNISGEEAFKLPWIVPRALSTTFPAGTPHQALFSSIGWAAMHSDLQDRNRVSVYFRSGAIGSGQHAHADENGFVINAGGKQILADSGYYDYYASPHHLGWTERTIAHNAITYDGGQGQPVSSRTAIGQITQFDESKSTQVLVSGEAKVAYGGDISGARRSIAYLRPGIVVVFDKMKSTAPHKWEWNFHSLDKLAIDTATNKAEVSNGGVRACLKFVGNAPVTGEAYTGFPVNPVRDASNPRPDQAHGRFVVKTASTTFVSAVVIDVGCTLTGTPDITVTDAGATVKVAGQTVTFDGAAVSAAPTPAPVASGPVVVGSTPAPTPAAPAIDTSASTVVEATDKTAAEVVGTGTTDTGATTGSTSTTTGSTGSETTSTTTTPKATRGHATWGSTSGASASSSATSSGKGRVTGSGSSGGSSGGGGGSASASSGGGGGGGGSGAARVSGGSSASASGSGVIMAAPRGTILRAPTKAPAGVRVIGSHIVKSTAPKAEAVKEETKAAKENDPLVDENAGTDIQNPEDLNAEDEEVKDDLRVDDVSKGTKVTE